MIQSIEAIRKKFHNEWLLIKVTKIDEATTNPLKGKLISHSVNRDEIYKKSLLYKGLIFIDHSEDKLPEGYAVAF